MIDHALLQDAQAMRAVYVRTLFLSARAALRDAVARLFHTAKPAHH